ncbi:M20 aminoacylase family protein [Acinetobacter sp. MB5]|uniref:M20 aminoacylase family protein n=1 Tax=Acinetobacter sp. MB5 TaxID=2069438 RepID=UPI000DD0CE9B|nr:M20 aminoacylase family protein [Acinetobacter sp. MB5]
MNQLTNPAPFVDMNEQYVPYVKIRHHLHQYPELEGETVEAANLVAETLSNLGYEVHRHIGGNGVVGVLKKGNSSKAIALRADMDALPIVEANTFAHASKIHGRMHACGHDGHTAIMLAAAELLAKQANFSGTVNLIFQPAEEPLTGAKKMLDDGLFTRFPSDAVFALHNMPGIPVGQIVAQTGPAMASSQKMVCLLKGKSGHGALPELALDPLPALSAFIAALQTIKSRTLAISEHAVISIGSIHAGSSYNIIPENVEIQLNVRTDTEAVREKINQRVQQILQGLELSYGIKTELDIQFLVPPVINSAAETEQVRECLKPLFGDDNVLSVGQKVMGSEDFAWMLHEVPGCYMMLGNGEGQFHGCSVHNPHYDFNDQIIPLGAQSWLRIVEHFLKPE